MDDRRMLELAAIAGGIELGADRIDYGVSITEAGGHRSLPRWNPLTDDGDALRLAVKLGIGFGIDMQNEIVSAYAPNPSPLYIDEDAHDTDPYAATRRAIVRAAAAIGEQMEGK